MENENLAEWHRMYDLYFRVINYIVKYRDEVLYCPDNNLGDYDFKRASWKKTAINELIRRLQLNMTSGVDPYEVIDYYWRELDEYYVVANNYEQRNMFDAMKCAVYDIGLVFV